MTRLVAGLMTLMTLILVAGQVSAQTTNAQGFNLERFAPAEAGSEWFAADSLDLRGHNRLALGLVFDYAHEPLVIRDPSGNAIASPVAHQLFAHVGASYVLWDRLRFAALLPVLVLNDGDAGMVGDVRYVAKDAPAFGDMRLAADVALWGRYGDPVRVVAGLQAFLPTGRKSRYTSDGKARFVPHVLVAGDIDMWSYGAALALDGRFRDDTVLDQRLGPTLGFVVAGGVRALSNALLVGPELQGTTSLHGDAAFTGGGSVLELLLGAHYAIDPSWRAGLGVARDFMTSVGSPSFRVLANVAFAMPVASRAPEPRPEPEVAPVAVAAPVVPVEKPVVAPPPPPPPPPADTDGDGIVDGEDACPEVAGVANPAREKNGCPVPPDADHDGIVDGEDACPDSAGDADPDHAKNGCPKVRLVAGEIQILDRIEFDNGKATLRPESEPVLVAVAHVLATHPELAKIRVEGYTDNKGKPSKNKVLSQSRVEAVVSWLAAHGVEKERLVAKGFGQENPIADNKTEQGRSRNRRVQFVILEKRSPAP